MKKVEIEKVFKEFRFRAGLPMTATLRKFQGNKWRIEDENEQGLIWFDALPASVLIQNMLFALEVLKYQRNVGTELKAVLNNKHKYKDVPPDVLKEEGSVTAHLPETQRTQVYYSGLGAYWFDSQDLTFSYLYYE